ncbi:MAG: hypothetical protein F4120_04685 [Rhodothermaceae bacterium]|nr:hypothetical protein [Rhodothermaceae bacterium]MYC03195.1 hypothetical protein [Rhodothermaceae bacterium]MYI16899.1 hypothetical protein [Rhodothermaceae bacterium]
MNGKEARNNSFPHQHGQQAPQLTIGIAPVNFSEDYVEIGCLNPDGRGHIKELRGKYGQTHAFRYDSRDNTIANIGLKPDLAPMGQLKRVEVSRHLWLFATAITQQFLLWFSKEYDILKPFQPLVCLGKDRLLTDALRELRVTQPDPRLDVVPKVSFDFRVFSSADPGGSLYLGLVVDFSTTNVIRIPVSELLEKNFDPTGNYVRLSGNVNDPVGFSHPLPLIGRIERVENEDLILDDVRSDFESDRIGASDVFLEPRSETLVAVTRLLYPNSADRALKAMRTTKQRYIGGEGKMEKISSTVKALNKSLTIEGKKPLNLCFGNRLNVSFGKLLDQSNPQFPPLIETSRPTMLFGAGGYNHFNQPDSGIRKYGPFQFTQNPSNEPTIVVLCRKSARGRVEQFVKALRDGVEGGNGRFSGGLVGKYRLTGVRLHFVEIDSDTGEEYANAASSALDELTRL